MQLTDDPDFEANPVMASHPDGSVVVAWPRMPDNDDAMVVLQRLNKAGQKSWANDLVLGENTYDYTWPAVLPVENGNTIVIYYKEWGYMSAPNRIIYAQKIDSTGANVWPAKATLFNGVMPVYVHPSIASDGNGGVFVSWMYEKVANHLSSFVNHVSGDGTVTMSANGVEVSNNTNTLALEPSIGCDVTTQTAYIFWRETDLLQNYFGLYGQSMDIYGNLKWGTIGLQIEPIGNQNAILPTITGLPGGAIVAYQYDFAIGTNQGVKACRLDSSGTKVWSGSTRMISTAQSGKGGLVSGPKQNSQVIYTWSDDRSGGDQIFAQNLCENGEFGLISDSVVVYPDTLWFLTDNDVFIGKMFYIKNPHDYSVDIQYIQQEGFVRPDMLPWYTTPWYPSFPVNIAAGDSLGILVKWPLLDAPGAPDILYDTLNLNTINWYDHVILAVDSALIIMGTNEDESMQLRAFPNPFHDMMKIDLTSSRETSAEITVYNTLMQPVRTLFSGRLYQGVHHLAWDGTNAENTRVEPGVYLVTIRIDGGMKSFRVVKAG